MTAMVIKLSRFRRCERNLGPAGFRVRVLGFRVLGLGD